MRTSVGNKHVPAFLTKLWKLVEDAACDSLISWSETGTSFVIHNDVKFAKELLPMYFKHNHMASFVRQLNMYGFRKLNHIECGGLHYTSNEIEFYHQYFIKGQESLLKMIKRKVSNSKVSDLPDSKQGCMKDVALSIKDIKDHQQNTEKVVKDLKQQNEILWKQLAVVNERCVKQQRLLAELVPIFFDLVQPNPALPYKRKVPLMIDDGVAMKKMARLSPQYLDRQKLCSREDDSVPSSPFSISNSGPVIHDVTEMETKPYAEEISRSPEMPKENEVFVHSPLSCKLGNSEQMLDRPFADREVLEPFNVLNYSGNSVTAAREEVGCKQSQMAVASTPSPHVPFHSDVSDVHSPAAKSYNTFASISTVTSSTLNTPCSQSMPPGDITCPSEFCGNDKNVSALKAMLNSVPDQNMLSNTLMSDTCLSSATEVVPTQQSFTVAANTCNPPLLLSSNVQASIGRSPVRVNCLNSYEESPNIKSTPYDACSPVISMNDNSHVSGSHGDDNIELGAKANQSNTVRNVLANDNFDENARGMEDNMNWLGSSDNTTVSNIDNWLGQLLRSEGIIASCDLDMSYNI